MTNSRKSIIIHREILSNELHKHEQQFIKQKNNLFNARNHDAAAILAMAVPVFLWGWQKARNRKFSRSLKHIINFSTRLLLFFWRR